MDMKKLGPAGRIAHMFINSKLTPLFIIASILIGVMAVFELPREEEPQIVVPMIDVFVRMPGASAKEVENRVTSPMEQLLWEIPGVEYVYSTSQAGMSMVIVRFYVGQDEEKSIVRLNQKLYEHFDIIPPGCSPPLIRPRTIYDVPICALTFHSKKYGPYELRRIAAQTEEAIKRIPEISEITLIGGQRRQLRVQLDPARLDAYHLDPLHLMQMLKGANQQMQSGTLDRLNTEVVIETGNFFTNREDVERLVVGAFQGRSVTLKDVAHIEDGPEEPTNYVYYLASGKPQEAAVTLAIAKRKGANAITIVSEIEKKIALLKGTVIPSDVTVTVTRDYGETSEDKSDELLFHMALAVFGVSLLIWFMLGLRVAGVVALAIPSTLALTLAVYYFYGYTLNRITLFALIFCIAILVDDAIVVAENIIRHYHLPENRGRPLADIAVEAVDEVGNPTIIATFTVIASVLPMAFVGGLMGPYMRPIPIGSSFAMLFSLGVAFVVTPWASLRLLKGKQEQQEEKESALTRLYRKVMDPLIHHTLWRWGFLVGIVVLLLLALSMFGFKSVMVKMLPFDNKNEFQVIIDMDEGTPLEKTARVTREIAEYLRANPQVVNIQTYVGTASPFNFQGLVRHYFLRRGSNVADIQVNLVNKHKRWIQSHDIAKKVRPEIDKIARKYGASVKVAEVPPGPPVMETLVAEVYGPDYPRQIALARKIKEIFNTTKGVVDVDWTAEADQPKWNLIVDKGKATLNGIATAQIAQMVRVAVGGMPAGLLHDPKEKEGVPILLRVPRAERSALRDIQNLRIRNRAGMLIPLKELTHVRETIIDKSIYHKNLMPVVYVFGDVAGREESPVYAILKMGKKISKIKIPEGYEITQYSSHLPFSAGKYSMKWDGEWQITYEVFRDLGIAFAAVMVLIYLLVVGWFRSYITPLIIMSAIPFSLIGIIPGHWVMGAFFTATSMIGFIAGAGIVVRNSIILVDFIELRLREGMPLDQAVVDAGAVRFRPMVLTAMAVIITGAVILLDPIFKGLAIALMAGEVASLLLSRMAVPILYFITNKHLHHGLDGREKV
jgi:multidrug efflux pump subunit AcrB